MTRGPKTRQIWPKGDLRYWQARIYRPNYRNKGVLKTSGLYVVQLEYAGRRTTFPLGCSNRRSAATRAREIYHVILAEGWEVALGRYKKKAKPVCPLTVGEYVSLAEKYLNVRPRTFGGYARSFRKIVSDISGLSESNTKRFDYQRGGRDMWLAKVNAVRLAALTPERIMAWQTRFVESAKGDVRKQRSARISANSFLREAKALFSKTVLERVELKGLDRLPFEGISTGERLAMRYRSHIGDFEVLVADSCRELDTQKSRETFKAFLLAALAGLRRNEIDLLEWSSFDFERGLLRIEATKYFEGKSESALGDVPLDPELVAAFRGFRAQAKGDFVIESSSKPKLDRPYSRYRCQSTFDALVKWLRSKGIKSNSPLHTLRKEFGSAMARRFGIFAASQALRHSDISVTREHYLDQKPIGSVGLGHLLAKPDNILVVPEKTSGTG
jgi:integrase